MLTNKFRKMLNCERVRCMSNTDLKKSEMKLKAKNYKNELQIAAFNYDGRYDRDYIYGVDDKNKLDELIKETTKGGIVCSM